MIFSVNISVIRCGFLALQFAHIGFLSLTPHLQFKQLSFFTMNLPRPIALFTFG